MTARCNPRAVTGSDPVTDFLDFFAIDLVVTPQQAAAVYRLRYRVYCIDEQFEPAEKFSNGQEMDEFDERSLHCLITHRATGLPAACVRMVDTRGIVEKQTLPFEAHYPAWVKDDFSHAAGLRLQESCEISRLAVNDRFRRRRSYAQEPGSSMKDMYFSHREIQTFPLLSVAGFLAATALTILTGRTNVFALMEPYLPRLMRRAGYLFQRVGDDIQFHGTRAVYYTDTQWALKRMRPELRGLYDVIERRIEQSLVTQKTAGSLSGDTGEADCSGDSQLLMGLGASPGSRY